MHYKNKEERAGKPFLINVFQRMRTLFLFMVRTIILNMAFIRLKEYNIGTVRSWNEATKVCNSASTNYISRGLSKHNDSCEFNRYMRLLTKAYKRPLYQVTWRAYCNCSPAISIRLSKLPPNLLICSSYIMLYSYSTYKYSNTLNEHHIIQTATKNRHEL